MTFPHRWRKSSRSVNGSECVEVAHTLDAVRDSKNPTDPTLTVPALDNFLSSIKHGHLDRRVR
jgi:hypothetical protein